MKNLMKLIVVVVLITSSLNTALAQNQNTEPIAINHTIYLGYPFDVFDTPDSGIYVGYNFHTPFNERFSLEAQASFSRGKFDRDSGTFAHDGGERISVNVLAGTRFYILKKDKNVRPYINALVGYNYAKLSEYRDDLLNIETFNGVGLSIGAYLEIKERFNVGAGIESVAGQADLVLKAGFTF